MYCARLVRVHLLPAERRGQRVIDGERVCQAIEAIGDAAELQSRAARFALLSDPTRLTVLTCIRAAGPISVSDLAAATGITDTTVSQTLRHLRASGTVAAERDGRVIRYRLADSAIAALLGPPTGGPPTTSPTPPTPLDRPPHQGMRAAGDQRPEPRPDSGSFPASREPAGSPSSGQARASSAGSGWGGAEPSTVISISPGQARASSAGSGWGGAEPSTVISM